MNIVCWSCIVFPKRCVRYGARVRRVGWLLLCNLRSALLNEVSDACMVAAYYGHNRNDAARFSELFGITYRSHTVKGWFMFT